MPAPRGGQLAADVRATLADFAARNPGRLVEVRVPPWAAVQVGVAGVSSAHRRGTPPHVVEMDAETWLALVRGTLTWTEAVASARVRASGVHADLAPLFG
ncbi:MAG: sterol carrier family protein [Propioniciclava sp.]